MTPLPPSHDHPAGRPGFTLVEILSVGAILMILVLVALMAIPKAVERARCVRCGGQMRQLGASMILRAQENHGRFYTKDEIGNSSYREYSDPLSLCQVLADYVTDKQLWMSPGAPARLKQYENSYAWSRAKNVTETSLGAIEKASNTILLWNNHTYTLPSIRNVPEGSTGGPRNANSAYYFFPWRNGKALNYLYADGHIETR